MPKALVIHLRLNEGEAMKKPLIIIGIVVLVIGIAAYYFLSGLLNPPVLALSDLTGGITEHCGKTATLRGTVTQLVGDHGFELTEGSAKMNLQSASKAVSPVVGKHVEIRGFVVCNNDGSDGRYIVMANSLKELP
jgi:hypothetical protein